MLPTVFNAKKSLNKCFICILSGLIFLSSFSKVNAQGNLLVTPKRVVFEGAKRSEELNLANIGKDSATYDISFIQIRMREDGSMENITAPDSSQLFADKYLRFFPRTVTLAPNEAQTVKVQLKKTEEMKPGEYRSHLYFRAVPREKPLGEAEDKKDSGISVRLIPIFGISMPVIIRVGEYNAQVSLSNLSIKKNDTLQVLKITINRTGSMSSYGDVMVDHISPEGKVSRAGIAKGLAVYTPNNVRQFNLPLNKIPGVNYHSGKLHVTYSDQSGKEVKLADEYINLN